MAAHARDGSATDTPTASTARSVVAAAVDGTITDTEWWAHRLVGADERSLTVFRVEVTGAAHDAYFAVVGTHDEAVYPAAEFDAVAELVATFRGDTDAARR